MKVILVDITLCTTGGISVMIEL